MKKITLLFAFTMLLGAGSLFGQATKQLNFGLIGVGYDIPVHANIAITPFASTNWDFNHLVIGAKGNFYFDTLLKLPAAWDVYGGANAGYGIGLNNGGSDFDFGLQAGGRWFWNETWGLYLEFGGGNLGATGGLGLTMRL